MESVLSFSVVESLWDFLGQEMRNHPFHLVLELFFVLLILYLLPQRAYRIEKKPEDLTEAEIDELVALWEPKPLIPADAPIQHKPFRVVSSSCGERIEVDKVQAVNFSSYNFLGFLGDEDIHAACEKTIRKYGIGACGPRGFYGTIDVHLEEENEAAHFMGTKESIIYSLDFAAPSSVIPAFLKRGDIILCDEGCVQSIKVGCNLSRAKVQMFRHNDMKHLDELLQKSVAGDAKRSRFRPLERRFIITEGLFQNYGDLAPLPELVRLKKQYRFRLMMDDSFGVGVLGKTGRGTCEHFGVPVEDVDILTCALSNAFASMGGLCTGSHEVVDHQRLSGAGYCFSAALPPYLATAGTEAMRKLDQHPELCDNLQKNARSLHQKLARVPGMVSVGSEESPIMHLRLAESRGSREADEELLERMVDHALHKSGIALTVASYSPMEVHPPPPSIRVCVCTKHTPNDLSEAAKAILEAAASVLGSP